MSTTNIHLLYFKILKSLTETFNTGTSELIPKKKRLKFLTLHSLFLHQNVVTKLLLLVLWNLPFWSKPSDMLQDVLVKKRKIWFS